MLRLVHVVGGQHQGDALRLQPVQPVPQGVAGLGVQPGGGLVEEQQFRFVDERAGDRQPALHAARQGLHPVIGPLAELGELQQAVDPGPQLPPGQVEVPPVDVQVLANRQLQVQVVLLRDHPEPAADGRDRRGRDRGPGPAAPRRCGATRRRSCAWWSSCRPRSARGSRTPPRRTPRSPRRRPRWRRPNVLVRPRR